MQAPKCLRIGPTVLGLQQVKSAVCVCITIEADKRFSFMSLSLAVEGRLLIYEHQINVRALYSEDMTL